MKLLLAISPPVLLMLYSQMMTKWRVQSLFEGGGSTSDGMSRLATYLMDPLIISAYVAALAASIAWMFVVERYAISIAFPLYIGLTVVLVAAAGVALLGEPVTGSRVLSIALIVIGVAIGSRA